MSDSAAPAAATSTGKKRKEGKTAACKYCDMVFKKLEHLQRHERTHTLDRPYTCDTCGKTFARQDTLHRHTRLHNRNDDDGPVAKGPKKRRISNASTTKPPKSGSEDSPPPTTSSDSSSSSSNVLPQGIPVHDAAPSASSSTSFPGLGLSLSLPVAPPSFPAYSQPELSAVDPAFIALPRRFSDVSYGTTLPTRHGDAASPASAAFASQVAGAGARQRPGALGSRPRALTLAGLPESLGCFSLANSPAPSDEGDSSSSSDHEGDSDVLKLSSASSDGDCGDITLSNPFAQPESHYPSPAFSAYSPTALATDPLGDLQAILDNDPVPASFHQPSPPVMAQPEFDYVAFAASIEGPSPSAKAEAPQPPVMPTTLEELLSTTTNDFLNSLSAPAAKPAAQSSGVERYPTPPSGTLAPTALADASPPLPSFEPPAPAAPFDLAAHLDALTSASDAQQQAREAAATAALFGGFGGPTSMATPVPSSAPALNFGLPTPSPSFFPPVSKYHPPPPPQQGLSLPISAPATAAAASVSNAANSFSLEQLLSGSPATSYAALSATYTTTYPSLSLPVAGFDLPNSTSATSTTPLPIAAPDASVSPLDASINKSLHDLLAAAWERRQRSGGSSSSTAPAQPSSGTRKSPFAHPAKTMPAFYIPSASAEAPSASSKSANRPTMPAPMWTL
ncbi:hypothetical protein JCM10207_006614 [Rhodosporidiobolus poonsookiae]